MISIDIDDREVLSALTRLRDRVGDLSPVMRAIAIELEARVDERFETSTAPDGERWEGYAPSTLARLLKKGKSGKPVLIDNGDMLGSLSSRSDATSAVVGFGQPYAAFHEFGTKRMPRRGMLFGDPVTRALGDDDRRAILAIVEAHFADQ
jgi:phage virion morphogenesis protein